MNNYGLIATANKICLDKILEKYGKDHTRQWVESLTETELVTLQADPYFHLRCKQVIDDTGKFLGAFALPGRGFGKNYMGSVFSSTRALEGYTNIALVGHTASDVRDKQIEMGPSSIIELYKHTAFCPEYISSKRRLVWPNGSFAIHYAGDDPDQVRGVSGSTAWVDELAKFRHGKELAESLELSIRESDNPFTLVTTTPRPLDFIKDLYDDPNYYNIQGSTLENIAQPIKFREALLKKDLTTIQARQEVFGEILWEDDRALWRREWLDNFRSPLPTSYHNLIIAVDPTTGSGAKRNDEVGIVVAASNYVEDELHAYIMEDLTMKGSPKEWATAVKEALDKYPEAQILVESNAGGVMVTEVLTKYGIPLIKITPKHHINSKYDRAMPVASFAERGMIHHCSLFKVLEDELCSFTGDPKEKSPNRLDALVIAVHALLVKKREKWRQSTF